MDMDYHSADTKYEYGLLLSIYKIMIWIIIKQIQDMDMDYH